ncbi:MAU2 sister chromatid cohesion factor [Lamellibrachia satsuma]|nr:MAU2 sister chromatid cohesion factor [Lamellibrachia satsuma]
MASGTVDPWYLSLLGLAENFRTSNPPNIKLCIHCLQTVFTFKPPPRIETRTHLQLGTVLFTHTKNLDLARFHLEKAIYEKQNRRNEARPILRKAIEISQQAPYWHCRLLFQLAQLHVDERDFASAVGLLNLGADYAAVKKADYTKVLFLLSKGMLLLIDKKLGDVHTILLSARVQIEQWVSSNPTQKESLRVFFLILQVCHYLMAGQVKSVKPALKQLQQSIQAMTALHTDDDLVSSYNPADLFQWLPKEHMCVLVYLVTVMHSMQAGYMDKAQKYTDKALMQIEKLKMLDAHPLLSTFQMMLLEHIILCRLIMGNKTLAIQEIFQACHLCEAQPRLFQTHGAQLHTLLSLCAVSRRSVMFQGLYAMSMNCMEAAEAQFSTAVATTTQPDLWTFINLNLAIVYLRTNRQSDLVTLLERVDPDKLSTCSHSLRASAFYVKGLQSFFQARYNEAKRYLRETLKMANAEDLNRLTSCSLVLLGHIFLSLGNSQEALNLVTPAMQLAGKIPDVHVQLWASALLKDLYRLCGNPQGEAEGYRLHDSFTQSLLKDHFQSTQQSEHQLIQWTEGPCPLHLASSATVNNSAPLPGGPTVGSSSPVAVASGAASRWPYRREQLPGGTVGSSSPVALPSGAAPRWPYSREQLPRGPTFGSSSPVALPSGAAPGGPTVGSSSRWPYRREQLPCGPTVGSSSLVVVPSGAAPRRSYRREQLPGGRTCSDLL